MTSRAFAAKPILTLTLVAMVLAGCNSRLNPLNWFGNSREVAVTEDTDVNPLVPRERRSVFARPDYVYPGEPIQTVTELRIERTRSGAIILVEGVASRQGPYEVQLTPANVDDEPVDGVLTYTFDVIYPPFNTAVGSEATRRVTVARSISNQTLAETRVVRVVGASNARETRRR